MQPIIDFSSKVSVSNTAYSDSVKYSYKASSGKYFLIREISLTGDSTFLSNGFIQAFLAGNPVTSQAGAAAEISALKGFTLPFRDDDLVILAPGEEFLTKFRVSSGTGEVQIYLIGMLLNAQEYSALLAKKGLV